jgi:hypothetical protein
MKSLRIGLPLSLGLITASALASGPTSKLYITSYGEFAGGTVTGLDIVQGLSENSFATGNSVDICIGVYNDVRTMGYSTGDQGSKFNLAGGPVAGGPYTNTIANSQLHDGTTDGLFNYSVDFTTGNVIQFDRNWANQVTLFNVSNTLPGAGWITMNALDGSFWLSQWGGPDRVEHRSHTGTLLGSFNSGVASSAGLALDPADGSLWMSDFPSGHVLYQFTQGGIFQQTSSYSTGGQWYGMEFNTAPVPEPASLAAIGVGFFTVLRRRRK